MISLKLAYNEVRLRINRDDLTRLLSGHLLSLDLAIYLDKSQRVEISSAENQNNKIQLISSPAKMHFIVLKSALLALEKKLPSKSGINDSVKDHTGNLIALGLEIDVKNR
jgi:hypothetical protein